MIFPTLFFSFVLLLLLVVVIVVILGPLYFYTDFRIGLSIKKKAAGISIWIVLAVPVPLDVWDHVAQMTVEFSW